MKRNPASAFGSHDQGSTMGADGRLGRRTVLQGGLGGLGLLAAGTLLGSCSSDSGQTKAEGVGKGPDQTLTAMFPRDLAYLAAGIKSRMVYTISDAEGVPAMELLKPLKFSVSLDGTPVGEQVEVQPHGDNVPRPYLPLEFTFPQPGLYDVHAVSDGEKLTSQVLVSKPEEVMIPKLGSVIPSAPTPTTTATLDVDPICTRVPTCPFHEYDLATVMGTGRPVVVLLATPAYCQTTACGPILDTLIEEAPNHPDDVVVIHSEVYKNPKDSDDLNDATLAPLTKAFNMTFEPSLFVTDAANTLVARGDIVVDRGEMASMLALAR